MRRLLFFALLAALPLLAFWVLKTPVVDRFLLRHAVGLAASNGVDLQIGSLDFDPWGPSVRVEGVRAAARDGSWKAEARSVRARLLLLKSLSGVPHVELEAVAPHVEGTLGPDWGGSGGGIPKVVFETLRVERGSVRLNVPGRELAVALPSVEVRWVENRGTGEVKGGAVTWKGETEPIRRIFFKGRRRFAALRIEEARFESQRLDASASGKFGPWGLIGLDTELTISLRDLPPAWVAAVGLDRFVPVETEISLSGHLGGDTGRPEFEGKLSLAAGRFGPLTLEQVGLDLSANRDRLRFRDLAAETDAGVVRGAEGSLSWAEGLNLSARGEVEDYDLRRFMALFVRGHFPVGVRATGSFEAEGPLYPTLALECKVGMNARDLDVTTGEEGRLTRHFALPSARVDSRCTVGTRELRFAATRVETPSVSVAISSGRIKYTEGLWFDTDAKLRGLDLVRQYVPEGFHAAGTARGRFGGPYRELRFDYELDLAATRALGVDLGHLEARASYDLHDLSLAEARLSGPMGEFTAAGKVGLHQGGRYDLEVGGTGVDLARLAGAAGQTTDGPLPEMSGTAEFSGKLSGPLAAPEYDGRIEASQVALGGRWRVERAQGEGSFSQAEWVLRKGTLDAYGAEAHLEGRGGVDRFTARGEVTGVSLAALEAGLGRTIPVRGVFGGTVSASGPYGAPKAEVSGTLRGTAAAGAELGDVDLHLRLEAARLAAEASAFGGAARAQAEVGLAAPHRFRAEAELRNLPWTALPPDRLPSGFGALAVTGTGRLSGALGRDVWDLTGSWSGEVEGARWQDLELGNLPVSGELGGKGLSWALTAWEGEAKLTGLYAPRAGGPLELGLRLNALDLQRLGSLLPVRGGRVSARGRALLSVEDLAAGARMDPLGALADLRVDGSIADLVLPEGFRLPEASLRVRSPEGLPQLRLEGEGFQLEGAAEDLKNAGWRAALLLRGFSPASVVAEGRPLQRLEGVASGRISARGSGLSVTEGDGDLFVEGLAYGDLAPSHWTLTGRWKGGAVGVEAREPRGVDLRARWAPGGELRAEGRFSAVPLEGWLRGEVFPGELSGRFDGRAEVHMAPGSEPEGRVELTRLEASSPPLKIHNDGDIRIRLARGEVRIDQLSLAGEGLQVGVSGGLRPGRDWDLEGKGEVDLAALRRWVPKVRQASGTGRATLSIHGPWQKPSLEGPVEVRPGSTLLIEGLAYPLEDLDASGYFHGDRGLTVEWVDAQFGAGRVHLEGAVGLDGLRPSALRLAAELRDLSYESPPQVSYTVDSDLLITGTVPRPEIRGEIRLKQFLYARRLNWKTMVFDFLKRHPREVQGGGAEKGTVFVDVSARGAGDLRVDNNLGKLSLGLDLRARGYLPRPVLWGRVSALEGTVRFRSLDYDVLQSSVEFLGEAQPVPLLDVHARTTVQQHTVTVDITGPVDDYQVTLASVPPLSQTDIVSLLTLGTTSEEVTAGQNVTAAEAASFLTGQIQDELESEVGGLLGFDQLQIDPVYSPAAQTTVPRVTIGKAVTQALRARYSASLGGQGEQDVEVQYTLNPRLSLLGTWSDRGSEAKGSLGGEVRVRFTFR